jgi:hypothetical protein
MKFFPEKTQAGSSSTKSSICESAYFSKFEIKLGNDDNFAVQAAAADDGMRWTMA